MVFAWKKTNLPTDGHPSHWIYHFSRLCQTHLCETFYDTPFHLPSSASHICRIAPMAAIRASLVAQRLKRLPATWETWVRSLGWEDPLEKEMATHCSILAWRIPWTEEPGRLQSMGSQGRTRLSDFTFTFTDGWESPPLITHACVSSYVVCALGARSRAYPSVHFQPRAGP